MANKFDYRIALRHGESRKQSKVEVFRHVKNLQDFLTMIEKDCSRWYSFNVYSERYGMQLAAYTPKFPPVDVGVTEDECKRMLAKKEKEKQRRRERTTYKRMLFK